MPAIDPIDAVQVRRRVSGDAWPRLMVHDSVGSTNAELIDLARAGADLGTVVATTDQSAGRGRRTRRWTTPPGVSLAVSLLVRPPLEPARWTWLPLLAGMAVRRAIVACTPLRPSLKWPNDVLLAGPGDAAGEPRKVCGILAEQVPTPRGVAVVVGCGINVAMDADELPVATATSLRLAGAEVAMTDLLVAVLDAMAAELTAWQDDPDAVPGRYARVCATIGRRVRVQVRPDDQTDRPDAFVRGRATGVDPRGCLLVDVDGAERVFSAGDVVHLR